MKYAVMTGASTGIGRAVAVEFGKMGYRVGLVARNKEKLEETKLIVEKMGGEGKVFVCDLADVAQVDRLIPSVREWTKKLDVLINAAGIWHGKDEVYAGVEIDKLDRQLVLDTFCVGLISPVLLVRGLIQDMSKNGAIINISGTFEYGLWGGVPYFASKRALEDFTLGLAQDLKDREVRVMCVSPADTASEEYARYFPEDAKDANTVVDVAKVVADMAEKGENGDFAVIKKGVVITDGYHK